MVSQTERATMTGEELEDWKGLVSNGKRAVKGLETNQWRLGDLGIEASENRHYGQHSLHVFAEEIGIDFSTLRGYVMVSRAYGIEDRAINLSWSHHKVICDREDRLEWLDRAKKENLSVLAMQRAIKAMETPEVQAPPKPKPDKEEAEQSATPVHEMTEDGESCKAQDVLWTAIDMLMEFRQEFELDKLCDHILKDEELGADLSTIMRWMFQLKQTLVAAGQPGEAGDPAIPVEHQPDSVSA